MPNIAAQQTQQIVMRPKAYNKPVSAARQWKPAHEDYPEHHALSPSEQDSNDPYFDYPERYALEPQDQDQNGPFFRKEVTFSRNEKVGARTGSGSKSSRGDTAAAEEANVVPRKRPYTRHDGGTRDNEPTIRKKMHEPNNSDDNNEYVPRRHARHKTGTAVKEQTPHNLADNQVRGSCKRVREDVGLNDSEYSEAKTPRKRVKKSFKLTQSGKRTTRPLTIPESEHDSESIAAKSHNAGKEQARRQTFPRRGRSATTRKSF